MNIAPPDSARIESRVAVATKSLNRSITRRRITQRASIGIGVAALLGLGGTSAATAFFPHYYDLQGIVKTAYVEQFVDCVRDAGWDATILDASAAAPILHSSGVDPATYSVISDHLLRSTEGQAGRAISACQQKIARDVGESITPGS